MKNFSVTIEQFNRTSNLTPALGTTRNLQLDDTIQDAKQLIEAVQNLVFIKPLPGGISKVWVDGTEVTEALDLSTAKKIRLCIYDEVLKEKAKQLTEPTFTRRGI